MFLQKLNLLAIAIMRCGHLTLCVRMQRKPWQGAEDFKEAKHKHDGHSSVLFCGSELRMGGVLCTSGARGPPQFLKKRSENAGASEFFHVDPPSIPGIAPGVAPRIVVFALLKSRDAIPRMEFRILRMEF